MLNGMNMLKKPFPIPPVPSHPQPMSVFLVKIFFIFWMLIFAVWTILTHIAEFCGLSFFNLCVTFSVLIIPVVFVCAWKYLQTFQATTLKLDLYEGHALVILVILALIGGLLALGAIRPDYDDVDYISRSVYFLNAPHEPLDLFKHDHALLQAPLYWAINLFYTLELFCAYIAYISQIPLLDVYHILLPILGGIMIPLAWFLAFSKFSKNIIVTGLAAAAVCVFLSLDGEPHRSFGNFAFVRIWQGKALLMSIGVPLFITFSLDFFHRPHVLHWCQLCILLIGTSGLSVMSSYFMPFLGIIIGLSYCYSQGIRTKGNLKKLIMFFSAYIYLCIIICYFLLHFNRNTIYQIGFQLLVEDQHWPTTFVGQFKFVFIEFLSYPTFLLIFFTIVSLVVAKGYHRKFLFAWVTLSIFLFLNPIVFPFISKYATTLNHYWRLFYLLPFPFVVGFPVTFIEHRYALKPRWGYLMFGGLLLLAIIGNLWSPKKYAPLATFGKLPFAIGYHKIDPTLEADIQQIVAMAKPGPMLAPEQYSAFIPRYSTDFPQVSVRKYMLIGHAITHGRIVETQMKFNAVDYISGQSVTGAEDAMAVITNGIKNIVISAYITTQKNWKEFAIFLEENAFQLVMRNDRILLYVQTTQRERNSFTSKYKE